MKKISWIASYPKSGNTYIRLLLTSYFYSKDGNINDFNSLNNIFKISRYAFIQNIQNIPTIEDFIDNPLLVSKYWIAAQESLSRQINNNLFIKTHDFMGNINNNIFTNEKMTKCFIYVVRDPRSVAVSYSHHMQKTIDETINFMTNKNYIILYKKEDKTLPEILSSWNIHYNSWKQFLSKGNGILIKYEDLITNPKNTFILILNFLRRHINFDINENKVNKTIDVTSFKNLQKLENEKGFSESPNIKNKFFRKGITNEWKDCLTKEQLNKIEKNFYIEMKELGYL